MTWLTDETRRYRLAPVAAVAQRLRDRVRAEDIVARLGGDEYAVLLQHATDEPAARRRGRPRGRCHAGSRPLADGIVRAMYTPKVHGKSRFELAANDAPALSDQR